MLYNVVLASAAPQSDSAISIVFLYTLPLEALSHPPIPSLEVIKE